MFETTGAMGSATKDWFDSMVTLYQKNRVGGGSLRDAGAPCTFSANSFSSYFSQRLSLVQAQHQAECVEISILQSLPDSYESVAVDACASR